MSNQRNLWLIGTKGEPGRVVTLVKSGSFSDHDSETSFSPDQVDRTWGVAFHIPEHLVKSTLEYLDHREKGGYSRHNVSVFNFDSLEDPS